MRKYLEIYREDKNANYVVKKYANENSIIINGKCHPVWTHLRAYERQDYLNYFAIMGID